MYSYWPDSQELFKERAKIYAPVFNKVVRIQDAEAYIIPTVKKYDNEFEKIDLNDYSKLSSDINDILKSETLSKAYDTKRKNNNFLSFMFKKRDNRQEIVNDLEDALSKFNINQNEASFKELKFELKRAKFKVQTDKNHRGFFKKSAMEDILNDIEKSINEFENPSNEYEFKQ